MSSSAIAAVKSIKATNDFVIKFANVNGTGHADCTNAIARASFLSGLPVFNAVFC